MKKAFAWIAALALIVGLTPNALATSGQRGAANSAAQQGAAEYIVVYAEDAAPAAARAAVAAAGGTIVRENTAVGVATVTSSNANFVQAVRGQRALLGAARNTAIGRAPADQRTERERDAIERLTQEREASKGQAANKPKQKTQAEPLADLQWDMQAIHATIDGSYKVQRGDKRVRVGIIDTGIDGSHPDIAPNFDAKLSRNFTQDIPLIDGPCEEDPDGSCDDPADVDEDGHGTHVAGTVGAPLNGLGMAGVAPDVTLVNLRAGQDSGYFFLQPSVDALTYAADNGIDVVNMSFYIDPWLYNCVANPADSPEAQQEQRLIIAATQRALNYAYNHRVTLIAAEGNGHTDLGKPGVDTSSPDFPPNAAYPRTIDNATCLNLPTEGKHVIGVTATGPSGRKAYYSDYGVEQADVAAPGGDYYDGTAGATNLILAPYPQALAEANGELEPDGTPNTPFVVRDCQKKVCAYYQYLQGTSMAAPHATGVAALIVSQYGAPDRRPRGNGLALDPATTEQILKDTATDTACPEPRLYDYPAPIPASYNATCEGTTDFNGFYGEGVVDALNAVTARR